ncbi:hypothetical protein ABEF95_000485 [Exophiala dermatitidis]
MESTSTPSLAEACLKLSNELAEHPPLDPEFNTQHERAISSLKKAVEDLSGSQEEVKQAMKVLTEYFYAVSGHGSRPSHPHPQLSTLLAKATREDPICRPLFGLLEKSDSQENHLQSTGGAAPDSILEVARRITARPWHESESSQELDREQIRSALRIIANCCADNNVNRSVIVRRNGIEALMDMLREKRECDLVIPTLYNVCVDYDEPAVDSKGNALRLPQQSSIGNGQEVGPPAVNAAEQKLGMAWDVSRNLTSVETLLGAGESAQNCLATLADLVEMASRVALHGMHYLVHGPTGDDTVEIQHPSGRRLIQSLLSEGADLATFAECRVSICQAMMNILSQPGCFQAMIDIDGAIWKLIHLPYGSDEDQKEVENDGEDENDEELLQPYRNAILKFVYGVSALDAYADKFDPESSLIRDCIQSLDQHKYKAEISQSGGPTTFLDTMPWAPICVLLANSITTANRAARLAKSSRLASNIKTLVASSDDPDVLLPAVDLSVRLAICREGQDALHDAGMMSVMHKLVKPRSQTDVVGLEIQRKAVTLIRLMIKGRPEYLGDLAPESGGRLPTNSDTSDRQSSAASDPILASVMSLFKNTDDASTRTEIGRLSIELVRQSFERPGARLAYDSSARTTKPFTTMDVEAKLIMLLSGRPDTYGHQDGDSDSPDWDVLSTPVDAMAFIITSLTQPSSTTPQPPRQPQQHQLLTTTPSASNASIGVAATTPGGSPSGEIYAAEGEAWFGLACLAGLESDAAKPAILATLARNSGELLKRLRLIITRGSWASLEDMSHTPDTESDNDEHDDDDDDGSIPHNQNRGRLPPPDARYQNAKSLVMLLLRRRYHQAQPAPQLHALTSRTTTTDDLSAAPDGLISHAAVLRALALEMGFGLDELE